jgi:hypothetical protein
MKVNPRRIFYQPGVFAFQYRPVADAVNQHRKWNKTGHKKKAALRAADFLIAFVCLI